MLILLSPAKTLDFSTPAPVSEATTPVFMDDATELIELLRGIPAKRLRELMSLSPKLAELNHQRFLEWRPDADEKSTRQALIAFKGDVYRGLRASSFSNADFRYAQKHLRILSGLYGLLRPLDRIQPYRLEMGTRLDNNRGGDLYQFWGGSITEALNGDLKGRRARWVANLASKEYFKAVDAEQLDAELWTPVFEDYRDGKYRVIALFAKKMRGRMASWLIQNRISRPEQMRDFASAGYTWNAQRSDERRLVFSRRVD